MLFITGLIGLLSLCVLIIAYSFGTAGFICNRYLCWCLPITQLHLWIICCICFWNESVGSLFSATI